MLRLIHVTLGFAVFVPICGEGPHLGSVIRSRRALATPLRFENGCRLEAAVWTDTRTLADSWGWRISLSQTVVDKLFVQRPNTHDAKKKLSRNDSVGAWNEVVATLDHEKMCLICVFNVAHSRTGFG